MIRVNLLAHREERRKRQRRQLGLTAIVFAALGGAVWLAVHGIIGGYVSAQDDRNDFLKKENAKLDNEIEEIRKLRDEINALLARKQIIEALQTDRARAVELLDQLVRQTPDGVYIKTRQAGRAEGQHQRLRAVERARVDPDAQPAELADRRHHAHLTAAGRDQGERGEQAAPVRVQHELQHQAASGRRATRRQGRRRCEEGISHGRRRRPVQEPQHPRPGQLAGAAQAAAARRDPRRRARRRLLPRLAGPARGARGGPRSRRRSSSRSTWTRSARR